MTNSDDDYPAVGHPEIDRDHAEIAAALRKVIAAVRADDLPQSQRLTVALISRVIAHFQVEKKLMEQISFPFIERHRDAHVAFLTGAQRSLAEMRTRGLTTECLHWTTETMGWFRRHVLTEDMALSRALAGRTFQ